MDEDFLVIRPIEMPCCGMVYGVGRRGSKWDIAMFARLEDARLFADSCQAAMNAAMERRKNNGGSL